MNLRGRVPDPIAIIVSVAICKFLTIVVAQSLVEMLGKAFGVDIFETERAGPFLAIDLVLTGAFDFAALWIGWYICRSQKFRVPSIAAALAVAITFVWRWVMTDYGWPALYEISLIATIPIALYALHYVSNRPGEMKGSDA